MKGTLRGWVQKVGASSTLLTVFTDDYTDIAIRVHGMPRFQLGDRVVWSNGEIASAYWTGVICDIGIVPD